MIEQVRDEWWGQCVPICVCGMTHTPRTKLATYKRNKKEYCVILFINHRNVNDFCTDCSCFNLGKNSLTWMSSFLFDLPLREFSVCLLFKICC